MKETNKKIADILFQHHQIDILKYEAAFLTKSIEKRMQETVCSSHEAYCDLLQFDVAEPKLFMDSMQISYSEFFRNPLTFSVLEKIILPTIICKNKNVKKREIRIWSAACASGQESYSISMLLNEYSQEKPDFRIFATDQSESQIKIAENGVFSESTVSNLSLKRVNDWFSKHGHHYTAKPELKENIEFSTFDLLDKQHICPPTSIFGEFDIIFCANVLFYYKPVFQKKIIEKLKKCLSENGFLITDETEREILLQHGFQEVYPQSGIFKKYKD